MELKPNGGLDHCNRCPERRSHRTETKWKQDAKKAEKKIKRTEKKNVGAGFLVLFGAQSIDVFQHHLKSDFLAKAATVINMYIRIRGLPL